MKNIYLKKVVVFGFFLIMMNVQTVNAFVSLKYPGGVDCREYALDMLDVIEAHFGCIDDAATYNLVADQIIMMCETMDE